MNEKFDHWFYHEYETPGCGEAWAASAAWEKCKEEVLKILDKHSNDHNPLYNKNIVDAHREINEKL